jgi:hypothetical protein
VLLGVLVAGVIWLVRRGAGTQPTPEAEADPVPAPSVRPPAPARTLPSPPPAAAARDSGSRPLEYADDGIPIMPPGPNDPRPDGPVHPHPITAEHRRIYYENHLLGQLDEAMTLRDVARMRDVLKEYREKYPEDGPGLQSGYELIANCLEHAASHRQQAQHYFDHALASTLRRYVLRYCLEGQR